MLFTYIINNYVFMTLKLHIIDHKIHSEFYSGNEFHNANNKNSTIALNQDNACYDEDMEVFFFTDYKIKCRCNEAHYECINDFIPAESLRKLAIKYSNASSTENCLEATKNITAEGWKCICIREKTLWCW